MMQHRPIMIAPSTKILVSWILATLCAAIWSGWPVFHVMMGVSKMPPLSRKEITDGSEQTILEVKRKLQKHFLRYGVYIPLEDIMMTEQVLKSNKDFTSVVRRVCGEAPLAVWLPLVIRVPVLGERSTEWCWKPRLRK